MSTGGRSAPRNCPVCGDNLALTRLGCRSCGTEISGDFASCDFCALNAEDRELLRVFLASRGNMKDVERHLGVSYPTARSRFDGLLGKLGIKTPAPPAPGSSRLELLESLAKGELDVDEVFKRLDGPTEERK